MKQQMVCVDCGHLKGQHASDGCNHFLVNGQKCYCKNKRTSEYLNRYSMGEPLDN